MKGGEDIAGETFLLLGEEAEDKFVIILLSLSGWVELDLGFALNIIREFLP